MTRTKARLPLPPPRVLQAPADHPRLEEKMCLQALDAAPLQRTDRDQAARPAVPTPRLAARLLGLDALVAPSDR